SRPGLWGAWNVLAKATLGVLASVTLAATTTVPDLLRGLERLRAPRVVTGIALFMVRYLGLVTDEARRMHVARQSRGYDPRWLWQARGVAASAGTLFVRSYERGERVHLAMVSRGYTGSLPGAPTAAVDPRAWALALSLPLAAAAVLAAGMLLG
ncbi:MAG TPA: energy-coupling factor transporter transmembrane component T, partial [Blastococcus sp.]|nr:energy-coupling factor transporter transmembrane component T [Blastococcus sp.]